MRSVLLIAVVGAACAATNTISVNANWYASSDNWSLNRFPRHDDNVVVNGDVTIGDSVDKPATYDGATEGLVIDIQAGEINIVGDVMEIGLQQNLPENCIVGTFGDWNVDGVKDACTKQCDTGAQSRSRTNTPPRFGGDACPDPSTDEEQQSCNTQACDCANGKSHGDVFAGAAKDYCKLCKCHNGNNVCDDRECNVQNDAQICESTTCQYGVLFKNKDEFMSIAEAVEDYGSNWATTQDFEMSTLVKHDNTDKNGKIFHCGHVRKTTDECKCYCSDGGEHHIWHHAERHAESIALGKTSAGCECAADWTVDTIPGQTFTGCQNPGVVGEPAGYGGEKHSEWCKIDLSTCPTDTYANRAGGDEWDTCESHATYKITLPAPIQ